MTPSSPSWSAVKETVADALELRLGARAAFLDRTCTEPALRAEVERLLRACERASAPSTFLDVPAAEFAAPILAQVDQQELLDTAALQGALSGRYAIERQLGQGGMATVYLARDERHGRSVALKVVHAGPTLEQAPSLGAVRFRREIEIAARLNHPHILPLHDSGVAAGHLYYIMPYVEGESLRDRLARTGPLSIGDTVRVLRDVTRALAHAHRHGVVHCDIKPGNILLNPDGDALVSDFGVAKALAAAASSASTDDGAAITTGIVLGTPAYIAPEQATGDPMTDHRADLYSLGVVAYEMLTGAPPFTGRPSRQLLAAQLAEVPEPLAARRPDVPPALATLVTRLLAKRPADRPRDATDVLNTLDATISNPESPSAATPARARPLRMRRVTMVGSALVLIIAAFAVIAVLPRLRAVPLEPSIAVLPFANTNGRAEDEPFSDGLTDELIGALSKVPGLKVAARTSTFALKGKALSIRTIADTLGVTTVLEGSVRRDGEQLKVATQLVNVRDSRVLWSETYDREFRDIFPLQEEIARDIVTALSVQLTGSGVSRRLVERGTEDLEAYQLYLKGSFLYNTRQRDALFRALSYFDQALKVDPTYARAYAGLADVYNILGVFGYERPHDAFPKARAAAERAIALDSLLAEAYAALAHQLFVYDWDWKAAEPVFARAIALNPSYPEVRLYYGVYLHVTGRHEEALEQLLVARALDPLVPTGLLIGRLYVNTHQPDQAIRYLHEALELNPGLDLAHQQLGHAYLQKQMHPQAIASLQRAAELSGPRDSAQLAYIYAATGQRAEARLILQRLLDTASQRYIPPFHIAMGYAGLGEADEAFRWLEAAYEQRASFMDGLAVTAGFESIRADPRFARLLRRMGLQPPRTRL